MIVRIIIITIHTLLLSASYEVLAQNPVVFDMSDLSPFQISANVQEYGQSFQLNTTSQQNALVWYKDQVPISSFNTSFSFNTTGEGFAFVIQTTSISVHGNEGTGTLGYGQSNDGLPLHGFEGIINSVAIEFDTFLNLELGDPDGNHISIHANPGLSNNANESFSKAISSPLQSMRSSTQSVRIAYDNRQLKIEINNYAFMVPLDIPALLNSSLSSSTTAWVGFTTTAALVNIFSWTFQAGGSKIVSVDSSQTLVWGIVDGVAGNTYTIHMQLRDASQNNITSMYVTLSNIMVEMASTSSGIYATVAYESQGEYVATYNITRASDYALLIMLDDVMLTPIPQAISIVPAIACAATSYTVGSTINGTSTVGSVAGVPGTLTTYLFDAFSNVVDDIRAPLKVYVSGSMLMQTDESSLYVGNYNVTTAGVYPIIVLVDGEVVTNAPQTMTIVADDTYPPFSVLRSDGALSRGETQQTFYVYTQDQYHNPRTVGGDLVNFSFNENKTDAHDLGNGTYSATFYFTAFTTYNITVYVNGQQVDAFSIEVNNTLPTDVCGDSICTAGENCITCPGDCRCVVDPCSAQNGNCDSLTLCTFFNGLIICGLCPSGYSGDGTTGCQKIIVRCPGESICSGNGNCTDGICACYSNFTGPACDTIITTCPGGGVCSGNGTCNDGICACYSNFTGPACDTIITTCPGGGVCSGNGNCTDGICACYSNFTGPACDTIITTCPGGGVCSGHGTCNDGNCTCYSSFAGPACDTIITTCPGGGVCSGHGTCTDGICACYSSFAGPACDTNNVPIWIGGNTTSPVVVIMPENTTTHQQPLFIVSVKELREVDASNTIISSFDLTSTVFSYTEQFEQYSTKWTYSLTLPNSACVLITLQLFNSSVDVIFANQSQFFSANELKLAISVKNWPFSSIRHFFEVVLMSSVMMQNEISMTMSDVCGGVTTTQDDSMGTLQWFKVAVGGFSMYGQFLRNALVDNTSQPLTITYTQQALNTTGLVTLRSSAFLNELVVDPNYSVLVDDISSTDNECDGNNNNKNHNSNNNNSGLSPTIMLVVVIVVPVVTAVLVVVVLIVMYHSKFRTLDGDSFGNVELT